MQYRKTESSYSDHRMSEIELDYKGLINGLEVSFDFDPIVRQNILAGTGSDQTEENLDF